MLKIFNIIKANSKIAELENQLVEIQKEISGLLADNTNLLETVESFKQKEAAFSLGSQEWSVEKDTLIKSHSDAIEALKADYDKKIKDLESTVQEKSGEANKIAASIISSIGVSPETVKSGKSDLPEISGQQSRFKIVDHTQKYNKI